MTNYPRCNRKTSNIDRPKSPRKSPNFARASRKSKRIRQIGVISGNLIMERSAGVPGCTVWLEILARIGFNYVAIWKEHGGRMPFGRSRSITHTSSVEDDALERLVGVIRIVVGAESLPLGYITSKPKSACRPQARNFQVEIEKRSS